MSFQVTVFILRERVQESRDSARAHAQETSQTSQPGQQHLRSVLPYKLHHGTSCYIAIQSISALISSLNIWFILNS